MCFIKLTNNNNTGCPCQSTHHKICDVPSERNLISHTFPNTEGSVWTSESEKYRKKVEAFMSGDGNERHRDFALCLRKERRQER